VSERGHGLLTAREVAELLSVSTETVLRWARRGDLPGFRLPSGQLRFRLEAIEAWLADRATAKIR
jgi:excisionase family DNA binding protein